MKTHETHETHETHVITTLPRRTVSGDLAYARAFAKFGERPIRSTVKALGFIGLVLGLLTAQDVAQSNYPVPGSEKALLAAFFLMAAIGLGLWLSDSVRKHPQAYAEALKLLGIVLVVAYVGHRVRKGVVHVIADGVAEANHREHHNGGW